MARRSAVRGLAAGVALVFLAAGCQPDTDSELGASLQHVAPRQGSLSKADRLSVVPDWFGELDEESARFGTSVASAGDVNGDGFGDIIVGAPGVSNFDIPPGRAFVFHGSASGLSASPNWTAASDENGAEFGASVASAGDVNGDGYDDVIVGAPYYNDGLQNQGGAWVYHGSASGLSSDPAWSAESGQDNAFFGFSVASAGDVNGDGYNDVIVGAFGYANDPLLEGRAWVYYGSAVGLSPSAAWSADSDQSPSNYGFSVASAGDLNGDGFDDIIVGASMCGRPNHPTEGWIYIYHGAATGLSPAADWIEPSGLVYGDFGRSVASAGDLNGDGLADIIVGAPSFQSRGLAYAYHGSAAGPPYTRAWVAGDYQSNAYFGWSVASAGDVNGDGYDDAIVGEYLASNGESSEGRAWAYLGSAGGLSQTAFWSVESNNLDARFGFSVASAGDVNGDGFGDVIVGSRFYDHGQIGEGGAFVYYGSEGPFANGADCDDVIDCLSGNCVVDTCCFDPCITPGECQGLPAACPTGGACEYSPGADGADCAGGLCLAGACVTDQCYIEGAWHLAGEPTSGCTYCDPALARTAWSNRPADYPDDCGTGPCPADGCEGPAWNDYPETCQRTCDGAGACQAACACAPVVTACAAGGCCLAVCDPVAGCASAAGTCADTCTGALLTLGRACSGCGASGADGTCGGGETFACNAGQLCGEQVCGGETAVCTNAGGSFAWRPSPVCDDGDPCTEDDTCSLGVCTGAALACDDQDPCTDDSCDPLGGCGHAYNTAPCDDGDACSMQDSCANGRCSGVPADLDGDGYLASACGGSDCDDGQAAVNPGAFEGPIGSAACQDGLDNDCDGSIDGDARGCRPCQQDADCDDGNACNGADSCEASQCQPGVPLECDDQNPCTADDCSLSTGCTHNPRPGPCDDGDACTAGDVCANGACDGSAVACDDQDPCTDDTCDPQSGCVHASHVGLCDDGDACTENDLCAAGICQGTPKDCSALAAPCIAGVCDPVTGNCEAQALPTSTTCDDGDECTADDHCWSGACQPGRPTCSGGCGCDATGEEAGSGWLLAVGLALLVGLRGRRRVAAT